MTARTSDSTRHGDTRGQSGTPVEAGGASQGDAEGRNDRQTYLHILKSSAIVGGSSLVNIAAGIVRIKAMAVLLGPAGIGLLGAYNAIADLAKSIAGMGINGSGVRQIAEAAASGETGHVARTAAVLGGISLLLGALGAGLLILLSGPLSLLTFATDEYRGAIALLSLAVLFSCVAEGQGALIQGTRRISDLARMGVLGSLYGTAIGISMVYFFREGGLVPSIVAIAAVGMLISWWYARRLALPRTRLTPLQIGCDAAALLKLGFAFMASTLMMAGAAYAIRLIVLREAGVESAGLYQAAWTLGGLYVGFILQAMGTDFYPRLTGVAADDAACNRMVNQQVQVSVLLAGPGVIATLAFAPWVITLFYSAKFDGAVEMLRWICLGMALRIVSWPIGFVVLAKGAQAVFFWTELAWTVVYLLLGWTCVAAVGVTGAGIAFFLSYVFHGFLIYAVVRQLSGFRWVAASQRDSLLFIGAILLVFCACQLLPALAAGVLGAAALALSSAYSLSRLARLVSPERIPRPVLHLLVSLRLVRPGRDTTSSGQSFEVSKEEA